MQHIQDPPVPPSQYNPGIPPAMEEIILRCIEKIPEMRFRDGSQLARALESLGEDEVKDSPVQINSSTAQYSESVQLRQARLQQLREERMRRRDRLCGPGR